MENKTISYLNSKIWYRLLKVFFILGFLIVLAIFNIIVFNYKNNNLNTDLKNLLPPPTGQTDITLDQFKHLPPPPKGQQGFTLDQIMGQPNQNQGGIISNIDGVIKKVLKLFLIGNFIILIFFEGVRRSFYYIVFGTIRPKNSIYGKE